MNLSENIIELGQLNGSKLFPRRREEINEALPYFQISKDERGKYTFQSFNYEFHDNANRMPMWEQYMKAYILPFVNQNICGFYNIELHDSYTYLKNNQSYKNVLSFSKFKNQIGPVLIPDPYMITNWNGMLNSINDPIDWMDKKNKVAFFGTTTGDRDHSKNIRIDLCRWAKDKPFADFYITKVAQMNPNNIPDIKSIYHEPVTPSEQLNYKFNLNVDGNTCRFDVWQMKTNLINLKYKSQEMLWYHPLLQNDIVSKEVTKDTMFNEMTFFNNNVEYARNMIFQSKRIANDLFRPINHQKYTISLFDSVEIH